MKLSVILSILMHTALAAAVFVLPKGPRFRDLPSDLIEVALVRAPRPVQAPVQAPPMAPETEPVRKTKPDIVKEESPKEIEVEAPPKPQPVKQPEASASDSSVASGENVGNSQVRVETDNFPFAYYLSLVRYRIQENWRPPIQSISETDRMSAVLRFRILRNGVVADIQLETSSNRFLFDQAAERAIRTMGKLPSLPQEFGGDDLTVHIEFESIW